MYVYINWQIKSNNLSYSTKLFDESYFSYIFIQCSLYHSCEVCWSIKLFPSFWLVNKPTQLSRMLCFCANIIFDTSSLFSFLPSFSLSTQHPSYSIFDHLRVRVLPTMVCLPSFLGCISSSLAVYLADSLYPPVSQVDKNYFITLRLYFITLRSYFITLY